MGVTDWIWIIIIVGLIYWVWSGKAARMLIPGYAIGQDSYNFFFGPSDDDSNTGNSWKSWLGFRKLER